MIPILAPTEMAAVDAAATEPVEVLIDRAGAAVAQQALDLLGGAYGRRVVVLAGPGHNGADGRAAAARLRRRGVRVEVVDASAPGPALPPADLVIDAAYGTGFRGEFVAPDVHGAPVLAVDIPSGVDGATGEERGRAAPAVRTVTFAALKPGLVIEPGRSLAGEVVVADIGLHIGSPSAAAVERGDLAGWLPPRRPDAHKWRAAVLVVAGSSGMLGAAHLTSAAAQRAGAGMVRLGSPGLTDDVGRPVEAVGLPLPPTGWAERVLGAAGRCHALVVGPGLGTDAAVASEVREVIACAPIPAVVDGDALTALGRDAAAVLGDRTADTILTPHEGEMERLTGAPLSPDRFAAVRGLAVATGAIVLLKGPSTIVAEPGGAVRVVTAGDARLATAGTGDVLSGVIGALLAQGVPPLEAAAGGAWLHARAAADGPAEGFVAGDLLAHLPWALSEARR